MAKDPFIEFGTQMLYLLGDLVYCALRGLEHMIRR